MCRFLLFVLLGCSVEADRAKTVDEDSDGWSEGRDCDDANAAINPDADEVCNGVDDDCDGATDPPSAVDAPQWYADADADGFG